MKTADVRCDCGDWWIDHNEDKACALCGCDWFTEDK